MIVLGLGLIAGVVLLRLMESGLPFGWAVLTGAIGVVIVACGVWPYRVSRESTKEGSGMYQGTDDMVWAPVGSTGHFHRISMPMSGEAQRLNGGGFRHLLYAEFDTEDEGAAWKEFVYDPLQVLVAEGIVSEVPQDENSHLHVTIYKLTGTAATDEAYRDETRERGQRAISLYLEPRDLTSARRAWRVSTTVVNHEQPLNPRIGMATVLM